MVLGVGGVSVVGCGGGCWSGLGSRVRWWVLVGSRWSGVAVGVGGVSVDRCGGGCWGGGSRWSDVVVGVDGVSVVGCSGGVLMVGCGGDGGAGVYNFRIMKYML